MSSICLTERCENYLVRLKITSFSDFNESQADKVYCSTNTSFNEIWWFYPSSSSANVDRYVVYNYVLNLWTYGTLARTAWTDVGIMENPIAAGADGYLYYHEDGFDDGSTTPASALTAYIESSQLDIGEGNILVSYVGYCRTLLLETAPLLVLWSYLR